MRRFTLKLSISFSQSASLLYEAVHRFQSEAMHGLQSESVSLNYEASGSSQRVRGFREGARSISKAMKQGRHAPNSEMFFRY